MCFAVLSRSPPAVVPSQLVVSLQTGQAKLFRVHSNYVFSNKKYAVANPSSVPFRLTYPFASLRGFLTSRRNVRGLLNAFYTEGSFALAVEAFSLVVFGVSCDD